MAQSLLPLTEDEIAEAAARYSDELASAGISEEDIAEAVAAIKGGSFDELPDEIRAVMANASLQTTEADETVASSDTADTNDPTDTPDPSVTPNVPVTSSPDTPESSGTPDLPDEATEDIDDEMFTDEGGLETESTPAGK